MARLNADIERLRGISILLVFAQHLPHHLFAWKPSALTVGGYGFWVGVDIFFAISGFVIARSLLPDLAGFKDRANLTRTLLAFWLRRAWRLWPAAWLWLLLPLAAAALYNRSGVFGSVTANLKATAAGVLQIANFRLADTFLRSEYGVTEHYWSLSLEEQFYLALPLAALLFRSKLWLALAALCAVRVAGGELASVFRIEGIAIGVLVAIAIDHPVVRRFRLNALGHPWLRYLVLGCVLGAMVLLGGVARPYLAQPQPVITLLCGALVFVAAFDQNCWRLPNVVDRMTLWAGSRSYALYLVHLPVFYAVRETLFRLGVKQDASARYLLSALAAAATWCAAEATWRWVEQPARSHGRRVAARIGTKQRRPG
ncbi:acyltransferase [Niveibacterium umoris]|uniref:Peptidoglycan/LPS O-acetylase OafA/YrhL n=1 Tax=Niveibacterium umoris TaxID=1193620 RepID=A0A840BPP1_9RHOO|nr:peptidoglycan/LPS O-acetylase OafA/YrhL [Niveibacterium umoris]